MDSAAASLKASPADENSAQAAHLVGLGVASGSGPHSVMEVIQDSDAISESHHQASERPASLVASDSVPGETTLGHRRPPPLNVRNRAIPSRTPPSTDNTSHESSAHERNPLYFEQLSRTPFAFAWMLGPLSLRGVAALHRSGLLTR